MHPRALLRAGLTFTVTAVILTAMIYRYAGGLLDHLLPLYRVVLQGLMPAFHLDSLTWQFDRGETVVAIIATLTHLTVVLDRVMPVGIVINASTLAAHAWVYPVLILSLTASWPDVELKRKPLMILLALPFALLGLLLDVPLMLWGAVEDFLYWQVDPARVAESLGSRVQHFLDGGGRYAVSIGLALLAIMLFRVVAPDKTATARMASSDNLKHQSRPRLSKLRP